MEITAATVKQLGQLARLDLQADEVDRLVVQLPKIVDYVSQLQSIEAPTLPANETKAVILRPDGVIASTVTPAILDQAPEREGNLWKVDAVFS